MGLVPDKQTSGRGELYSMLVAVKSALKLPTKLRIRFVTDAQYVVTTINHIVLFGTSL